MKNKFRYITVALVLSSVILFFQIQSVSPALAGTNATLPSVRHAEVAPHGKPEVTQIDKTDPMQIAVIKNSDQVASADGGLEFIQTSINAPDFTTLQTYYSAAYVSADQFPSLDQFAAEVRGQGMGGLWADGLFAYRFYSTEWGVVPDSLNTASYSSFNGYHGYFIHNYLGGSQMYNVGSGTLVAVIGADDIDWYEINGIHRFVGTSTGNGCEYTAPFYDWNGDDAYSAVDLLKTYYTSPFAIQTCICTGEKNGMLLLTGSAVN